MAPASDFRFGTPVVDPGDEAPARGREHHHPDLVVELGDVEQLDQIPTSPGAHGIQTFRPVERHNRDARLGHRHVETLVGALNQRHVSSFYRSLYGPEPAGPRRHLAGRRGVLCGTAPFNRAHLATGNESGTWLEHILQQETMLKPVPILPF